MSLVLGMPQEKVSGWILGCATEVFDNFVELKAFLRLKYEVKDVQLATANAASLEPITEN